MSESMRTPEKALRNTGLPTSLVGKPPVAELSAFHDRGTSSLHLVERFDNKAVAAGHEPTRSDFVAAVNFLLEYFPPEDRVPPDCFLKAAKDDAERATTGDKNGYALVRVTDGNRILGAASLIYIADANTVFIGFIRVADGLQRQGIGRAIFEHMKAFGKECVLANGGSQQTLDKLTITGEVEPVEGNPNPAEVIKRRAFFANMGLGYLDDSAVRYFQATEPTGETAAIYAPFSILFGPVFPEKYSPATLSASEVKDLVRAIYARVYAYLEPAFYRQCVDTILGSITADQVAVAYPR